MGYDTFGSDQFKLQYYYNQKRDIRDNDEFFFVSNQVTSFLKDMTFCLKLPHVAYSNTI